MEALLGIAVFIVFIIFINLAYQALADKTGKRHIVKVNGSTFIDKVPKGYKTSIHTAKDDKAYMAVLNAMSGRPTTLERINNAIGDGMKASGLGEEYIELQKKLASKQISEKEFQATLLSYSSCISASPENSKQL